MKKSELFPVLIGYASKLPPETIMDIEILHRLLVDKLNINVKPSTLKQYLTLLANAGFSIKKKRVTKEKPVYFVVGDKGKWPFKQTLSEVKELSTKKGSATVEVVPSRKELGAPLISMYKQTGFEDPEPVTEAERDTEWHDIEFSQLSSENLREILIATRISDKSLARIFRRVMADTFGNLDILVRSLEQYDEELTKIKECKADLEKQKTELNDEKIELKRQVSTLEFKVSSCETNISDLEKVKATLSEKLLQEQDRNINLEKKIAELQRDKENLEKRLRGASLDRSHKFVTIGDVMEVKQSKGG